jgi:hypothetical protein
MKLYALSSKNSGTKLLLSEATLSAQRRKKRLNNRPQVIPFTVTIGIEGHLLSKPSDIYKLDCSSGDKIYNNSMPQILFEHTIATSFNKQAFHSIQLNTMG